MRRSFQYRLKLCLAKSTPGYTKAILQDLILMEKASHAQYDFIIINGT